MLFGRIDVVGSLGGSDLSDDDTEDTENIIVERFWDNQLQYLLSISGRMFHIGGTIPIHMSFLPMAKMKIHRLSVILEGAHRHCSD